MKNRLSGAVPDDGRVRPDSGAYVKLISSDDHEWGGSGYGAFDVLDTQPSPFHGYPQSVALTLPPLGAVVIGPRA